MENTQNTLLRELPQFHGSEELYRIPLIGTCFTQGIKYLAESVDCFWLVTDASVIAKSLSNRSYFITVDFKRLNASEKMEQGYEASLEYGDGNGNVLERQFYHATDFPLEKLRLFFVNNTLMLPSEY